MKYEKGTGRWDSGKEGERGAGVVSGRGQPAVGRTRNRASRRICPWDLGLTKVSATAASFTRTKGARLEFAWRGQSSEFRPQGWGPPWMAAARPPGGGGGGVGLPSFGSPADGLVGPAGRCAPAIGLRDDIRRSGRRWLAGTRLPMELSEAA